MGGLKFSFILYCLSEVLRKIVSYDLYFIYVYKLQNYNEQNIEHNNWIIIISVGVLLLDMSIKI